MAVLLHRLVWLKYSRYLLKIKAGVLLLLNVAIRQLGFSRTSGGGGV